MLRRLLIPALALCLGLCASPAQAGLLPVNVSVNDEGNFHRFTYSILLPTGSQLRSGDYFTIYDFAGYQTGSAVYSPSPDLSGSSTDWTVSVANTGTTPDLVNPYDNNALPNLTWTYTGPTIESAGLGNFWAVSLYGSTTEAAFTARTHVTAGGPADENITETTVPLTVPAPPGVPEPATLALAGVGLPFLVIARRLRRKQATI